MNPVCEPITFLGKDGYIYSGLFFHSIENKGTVIHVHGSCGNFLSFTALLDVVAEYISCGYNLLSFNLKSNNCIAEGNWNNGRYEYVGGAIVDFNECISDIDSAVNFCSQFTKKIILQGHSMGCERVITYQIEKQRYFDTILISPCNAYELQKKFIKPDNIESQIERLVNYKTNSLLHNEYGINNNGEKYLIPIYRDALISIMSGYAFKLFRVDKPKKFFLPVRCVCCLGEYDKLQTETPDTMFNLIADNFNFFERTTFPTDHEFTSYGKELGKYISTWLNRTPVET